MGTSISAEIGGSAGRVIRTSIESSEPPARTAAKVIGPISKTSPFIKDLSDLSVRKSLGYFLKIANQIGLQNIPPEKVLSEFGVDSANKFPFRQLSTNLRKRLSEELTAQEKPLDTALAAQDAISQSLQDIMRQHLPATKVVVANRNQIANAFKEVEPRTISQVLLKNVIANLINRRLDSARADIPPDQVGRLKSKISKEFAPKLAEKIIELTKGLPASAIPSRIPEWADELKKFVEAYKL